MIIRMLLNLEKMEKKLENFKDVKIDPISKGLAIPTNPSTKTLPFEGCSLCDVIRHISIDMSTGKHSFFLLLSDVCSAAKNFMD